MFIAFCLLAQTAGVPTGFKPVDEAFIANRKQPEWDAPSYMLSLAGDHIRVETREAWYQRTSKQARRPSSSARKIDFGMSKVYWQPGDGVRVDDGWICGYDNGEFGGGLYWFSSDGSKRREVDPKNIPIVAKTTKGIFAIRSLTHMMFWYADLVAIVNENGAWRTRPITDLHESPGPILQSGDRFIYATDRYVSTLETDGTQHEIYHPWFELHPESMVRQMNGELWIGSTEAVLRLTAKPNGRYSPQWFVPMTGHRKSISAG